MLIIIYIWLNIFREKRKILEWVIVYYVFETSLKNQFFTHFQNYIVGGNLNAGCDYVRPEGWDKIRLRTDPSFEWYIKDGMKTNVNTSRDCAYDR